MRDSVFFLLFSLGVVSFVGAIFGAADAAEHGRCEYQTIADFFPGHALACELFKKRW